MASGNKVVLTFAGETKDLEQAFDKVGAGARTVGTDASSSIDKIGTASTRVGRTAKGLQGALGGLVASGQGVSMMMEGDILGGLLMLEGGFGRTALSAAKLAKNAAATAVSFVASSARMAASMATTVATTVAGWVVMGVQAMVNAAKMAVAWLISLGPIGLVILAIGAVIGILVALGVGFDDLKRWAMAAWDFILGAIKGVWNWVSTNWPLLLAIITGPIGLAVLAIVRNWDTIKSGFTAVKDWIRDRVNDIVSFITGIPGRIADAAASIGSTIINGIQNGITSVTGFVSDIGSAVKGAINSALHLPFTINGPGPLPDFTIPSFHTGGTFHAPGGQREGLAMLLDGERVSRPGAGGGGGGGGVVIKVYGSLLTDERKLVKIIRDEFDRGGFR